MERDDYGENRAFVVLGKRDEWVLERGSFSDLTTGLTYCDQKVRCFQQVACIGREVELVSIVKSVHGFDCSEARVSTFQDAVPTWTMRTCRMTKHQIARSGMQLSLFGCSQTTFCAFNRVAISDMDHRHEQTKATSKRFSSATDSP